MEWVLLALIALPTISIGRMTRYELVHAAVWLHSSLASVRHAPLFALAVAPGFARCWTAYRGFETRSGKSEHSLWPGFTAILLGWLAVTGIPLVGFDSTNWPLAALPSLNRAPVEAPLFHEQDWGGLIEASCDPRRPAFIDDRFELYGKEGILRYVNALEGGPDWDLIRDHEAIALVWLRPERGLSRRLATDPALARPISRHGLGSLRKCKDTNEIGQRSGTFAKPESRSVAPRSRPSGKGVEDQHLQLLVLTILSEFLDLLFIDPADDVQQAEEHRPRMGQMEHRLLERSSSASP